MEQIVIKIPSFGRHRQSQQLFQRFLEKKPFFPVKQ